MAFLKGLIIFILTLAIMGVAIAGSYIIAQNNPFDGQHKHQLTLVVATEPTCDTAGVRQHYACSGCDGFFGDEKGYVVLTAEEVSVAPLGHGWLESTCGVARKCEYCGATEGEAQAHKPGSAVKENIVPATCISEGSYDSVVYCTACGEKISSETKITEKKSHTPGATVKQNEIASTCYAEGSYENVVYCSVEGCGVEMGRTTVKTGKVAHTPAGEAVIKNEKAASCTENGSYDIVIYCTVDECGAEISKETKTVTALGHADTDGNSKCDRCSVSLCSNHTPVVDAAVPATCTSDGLTEGSHCSNCGQIIKAQQVVPAAHKLEMKVSGALTINKDGSADTSALLVVFNCTACSGYQSESVAEYSVNTANAFTSGVVITSGDYTYKLPALDLVNYEVSSTYNVGTYNDRTPTVTTAFALKDTDLVCNVISGDAINLIEDGSKVVYSRYELSKLCNDNVTITYDEATGYHYASKKAHTIPYIAAYGTTLTITGTVDVMTKYRVNVNNALVIGTDELSANVKFERTQLLTDNNHVLGLYGGGDLTIKNGTLTLVGIATSEWAVDLYVKTNGTVITIEKKGNLVGQGKGEYIIYSENNDTKLLVDGTIVANKPIFFKTTFALDESYEYGYEPSLYIRNGSVILDGTNAEKDICTLTSVQVGSEKENATGYLSIKSDNDLIIVGANTRITFAKGTIDFNCTVSGKTSFNTAGATKSCIIDVKKGATVNATGVAHVFGLWSKIDQCWMFEEGATYNAEGISLITNAQSSVNIVTYKTVEMNIDGQLKQVTVANMAKKGFASASAMVYPTVDTNAAWTTDTATAAVNGFLKATDANGNVIYYK